LSSMFGDSGNHPLILPFWKERKWLKLG
jgi:hypothetical protein